MLTTTALVLAALTASVSPEAVSPAPTTTYTTQEQSIHDKAYNKGIHDQYCLTQCAVLRSEENSRKDRYKKTKPKPEIGSEEYINSIGDDLIFEEMEKAQSQLHGEDFWGSKKSIAKQKAFIKKRKCDCSKYKYKNE